MIVLNALLETITFVIIATLVVILLNYIFNKDFRINLINKIKKVILSNPRKANKTTQIKNIIYNYFFVE